VKTKLFVNDLLLSGILVVMSAGCKEGEKSLPNILICIADDASYPHMGEGCRWVNTPGFDEVAREG